MTKIKTKPRGKKTDRTLPAIKCKCTPELEQWLIPIADLTIDPGNARSHPIRSIESLKASLSRFGFQKPIVADASGRVVAGNGQLEAAIALGWTHVPVVKTRLSREEARAYAIADNRTAELSTWDFEELSKTLSQFTDVGIDLGEIGFIDTDLRKFMPEKQAATEDEINDPPENPVSRPGDIWVLGGHRLSCGDCTSKQDVGACLAGSIPGICVTDPPYGVNYDPAWRNRAAAEGKLAYAARRVGAVPNDHRADWKDAWDLFPGDVIYSWHPAGATSLVHAAALEASGFVIRMQIIWAKSNFPIGRGDYHVRHEPCWYAVRKGRPAQRTNDRTQTTLWEIDLDKNVDGGHSTQKPLECMARAIRNHDFGEVYEPFSGSGTTIIACEQLGRTCYALEIDPAYTDVAVRRWEKYTGKSAILEGDGRSFAEVAETRLFRKRKPVHG